jgi:glutamate---cysteine ligase / carboxylate-amine ligase
MHPCARAGDTVLSAHPRYRHIGDSMRVLARREPTLATHIHVGVAGPEDAVRLLNRLRAHLPLLLALSANSPFWQGRRTGFASMRTTLFDAFPRSGPPRGFRCYADWIATVDRLVGAGAIADPSFLWWDVRLQPRYGTVEVRIMDAQTRLDEVAAVAALVQALASLELTSGDDPGRDPRAAELLEESRFLAARDGMAAVLIDVRSGERLPARQQLERTLSACRDHSRRLRCERELAAARRLGRRNGAVRQLVDAARNGDVRHVAARLAGAYVPCPATWGQAWTGSLACISSR